MFPIKPIRDFLFGTFYLISGLYSVGFGLFVWSMAKSAGGTLAYVVTSDAVFPLEVTAFEFFGVVFLAAACFQFRKTLS
jgi:hypothetical protein